MSRQPIVVILGGGTGLGLYPLTKNRSKAAVPVAGKYRLIDVPISNCLSSEFYQIFVLTQSNSGSLNRHIVQTFQMPNFIDGFVDVRAASLTPENPNWYQGTADAVRQNLSAIQGAAELAGAEHVLILSGDHLYQMDYRKMMDFHLRKDADITIAVSPVEEKQVQSLGIAQCEGTHKISRFVEKPSRVENEVLERLRIPEPEGLGDKLYRGSMGIYIFRLDVLDKILKGHPDYNEFGRDVLPYSTDFYRVFAYTFDGFWENVGTIHSFYEAMLGMTNFESEFDFFATGNKFRPFSRNRSLPASKINLAEVSNTLLSEGAIVEEGAQINRSVVGMRALIGKHCQIDESVLFGCDFYESVEERQRRLQEGLVPLGIGEGSILKGCIIDKNVRIGRNVVLENPDGVKEAHTELLSIRDGVIVVPKEVVIADHFRLPDLLREGSYQKVPV